MKEITFVFIPYFHSTDIQISLTDNEIPPASFLSDVAKMKRNEHRSFFSFDRFGRSEVCKLRIIGQSEGIIVNMHSRPNANTG